MTDRARWGILGTGKVARIFAKDLQVARSGILTAIGSRDSGRAAAFASEFGVARSHGTYGDLIRDPDVEFVYIATPHPTHVELAVEAAAAGKHVLCEKPLAVDAAEAAQMVAAARSAGTFLMEAFAFRCHPQTDRLLGLIRSGEIGEVRLLSATFGYDAGPSPTNYLLRNDLAGGSILDVGCYTMAFARQMVGEAVGQRFLDPVRVEGAGLIDPKHQVDLDAAAIAWFEGGIVAQLSCSIRTNLDSSLHLTGTQGVISLLAPYLPGKYGGVPKITVSRHGEPSREVLIRGSGELYAIEADTAVDRARRGLLEAPEMSWADSIGNMAALDRWREVVGVRYGREALALGESD
jgi:predicted dehydrogenase